METELDSQRYQNIAARINMGAADPETSRALVVFNLTDAVLSGIAVFYAEMSWPKDAPLPPVVVRDWQGTDIPSTIADLRASPDRKNRADRCHLSFTLRFAVTHVPAHGWKTYLAAYADTSAPNEPAAFAPETPGLVVVETTRHGGDLPPEGNF